jgi:hypothetical protein
VFEFRTALGFLLRLSESAEPGVERAVEIDKADGLYEDGPSVVKVHTLLTGQGVCVPTRSRALLLRAVRATPGCLEHVAGRRRGAGPRVQADFGRMRILYDPPTDRRRVCHALIFTPCVATTASSG